MGCTAQDVVAAVRAGAETIAEHRDELIQLDRAIGDADHGENLDRGFRAVVAKLDTADPDSPAAALKLVASVLISTVGGAAGPLYGTAFLRAASAVDGVEELDGPALATAIEAGMEGVTARGKAVAGEKTMIDALAPAVAAARAAAETGDDPRKVISAAAEGAHRGVRETGPLIARKGRASYLGERSAGHLDPGSRSTALLLSAFAESGRLSR